MGGGALIGLLAPIAFMAFMMAVLAVFLYVCWQLIKKVGAKTTASWSAVADRLGLNFSRENERKDPFILGRLEEVEVEVSLTLKSQRAYRPDRSFIQNKVGTRVEARLKEEAGYWVMPKVFGSFTAPEGMKERPVGSGEFAERYRVFATADEGPSEDVCQAIVDSSEPVAIIGDRVVWWCAGIQTDEERLVGAVRGCVAVAGALGELGS